jgi:hypothetical protein
MRTIDAKVPHMCGEPGSRFCSGGWAVQTQDFRIDGAHRFAVVIPEKKQR